MPKHDLIFYENRSTPEVVTRGAKGNPKKGYGRQTARRAANAEEERKIASGDWIRTRQDGKGPNEPGSKRSKLRPQQAAKQKTDKGKRLK